MSWLPDSASCSLGGVEPDRPRLGYSKLEACDIKPGPGLGAAGGLLLGGGGGVAPGKVGTSAVALPPLDVAWRKIACISSQHAGKQTNSSKGIACVQVLANFLSSTAPSQCMKGCITLTCRLPRLCSQQLDRLAEVRSEMWSHAARLTQQSLTAQRWRNEVGMALCIRAAAMPSADGRLQACSAEDMAERHATSKPASQQC